MKYAIISNKKRNQLVLRVAINGQSVSRVARQLRMKLPSAKSILRTYKKSGRIFDKKRILNRGIRTKKHDLSDTEHHQSQEEIISQPSHLEIKPEFSIKEENTVKMEQKPTQISPKGSQITANQQKTFENLTLYRDLLHVCLQRELNYFKGLIGYYRISQLSQKLI